jgi:hypothetical protein
LRVGAGDVVGEPTDKTAALATLGKLIAWCRGHKAFLWTAERAAEELEICPRTLWEVTNAGEIPYKKIGKQFRYSPVVLQKWFESHPAICA